MAWNIPRQIGSLLVGDDATQRAISNVSRALQPVLDFCNSTFAVAQNGALTLVRDVVTQAVSINGGVSVNGNVIVRGTAPNCFVVVPPSLLAAFYVTNPGNTVAQFLINGDGTAYGTNTWSTTSFVSNQGFKEVTFMGTFYNTSTSANTFYNVLQIITNQNAMALGAQATILRQTTMVRPGSVTGISVTANNTVNATGTYQLCKNGNVIYSLTHAPNAVAARITFPKGQFPFVAGDNFFFRVAYNAAINIATQIDMEMEVGA